jgi:hypothetical protein
MWASDKKVNAYSARRGSVATPRRNVGTPRGSVATPGLTQQRIVMEI